jgi:DNA-binding MarR family transcriptional regulator
MRLEDEIKQERFENEAQKLLINILYTGICIQSFNYHVLKPFSLTPQQYNILRILRGQYPNSANINTLIDRMMDKMSNASRLVDKLLEKKLVKKTINPQDKRQASVAITQKGLDLLSELDVIVKKNNTLSNFISDEEAKICNQILDKARNITKS